ncbi:MAG: rod shape-determining protein, partial [Proteobacteria bacterium]|nr:rod shape-determining protein [Pseudomonadota bacterium]
GGNHVTNDIAVGLRTPAGEAEKIKRRFGCCLTSLVGKDETIEVPSVGDRRPRVLNRRILAEIVEPRMEELFSLVRQDLEKNDAQDLVAAGVVLTGGGSSLDGAPDLAERVFGLPVRRGTPQDADGLVEALRDPAYATGVGLVLYAARKRDDLPRDLDATDDNLFAKVTRRMKAWFKEFF